MSTHFEQIRYGYHWHDQKFAGSVSPIPAHEADLVEAIRAVEMDSHGAASNLRGWRNGHELLVPTSRFRFEALLTRYPVDADEWWRYDCPAPEYVLIGDLPWKGALFRLVAPKLRYVCNLVQGCANLLAAWEEDVEGPYRPTDREAYEAVVDLSEVAEEVSLRVSDMARDIEHELIFRWEPQPFHDEEDFEDVAGRSRPRDFDVRDFCVDPRTFSIRYGSKHCSIGKGRAFDLLVRLNKERGEYVPFETLLKDVWRGTIVSDNTIHQNATKIRAALAAHGIENVKIESSGNQDYRLVIR